MLGFLFVTANLSVLSSWVSMWYHSFCICFKAASISAFSPDSRATSCCILRCTSFISRSAGRCLVPILASCVESLLPWLAGSLIWTLSVFIMQLVASYCLLASLSAGFFCSAIYIVSLLSCRPRTLKKYRATADDRTIWVIFQQLDSPLANKHPLNAWFPV